ncbi:MAG: hypothetical protein JNK64_28590 [Myxococcales bacterium]|nr:hypothetical protein [Myxococcales bacterium]
MTRALPALGAALGIAAMVACSAGRPVPQTSTPGPPLPPLAATHDEIAALDAQLTADRDRLGLDAPTADDLGAASAMTTAANACTPDGSQACTDVCTLATSICDNATKICDLAAQLPGDAWAVERCDSGKATCAKAATRCCDCAG